MRKLLGLVVVICAALNLAQAQSIRWIEPKFPPFNIEIGPHAGEGVSQLLLQQVRLQTTDIQQQIRTATFARLHRELKESDHVCNASLIKTPEREEYIVFSKPWLTIIANGLIIRRADLSRYQAFMSDGELDLVALLKSPNFTLSLSKGRNYGPGINSQLEGKNIQAKLVRTSGDSDLLDTLRVMLVRGSVDATIGYPSEAQFFAREHGLNAQALTLLPIKGALRSFPGYVGCSRSELGQKMIERVNQVIDQQATEQLLLEAYRHWLDPETDRYYMQQVLKRP